jgi:hypothetical protein
MPQKAKPHLSLEMGFCYCLPLGPPSRVQKKPRVKLTTGQTRGLQNLFLNPNFLSLSSLIQDKNRTTERNRTDHIKKQLKDQGEKAPTRAGAGTLPYIKNYQYSSRGTKWGQV